MYKLVLTIAVLASFNSFSMNSEDNNIDNKSKDNKINEDVLETANLIDEINLLKLKLEKEKLDKNLNEEMLNNIEIKKGINNYLNTHEEKEYDPADGPFNAEGIRLLSVTSLQNNHKMAVFSFYGRKYNRSPGDNFKESVVSITDDNVVFNYSGKLYNFSY